MKLAPHGLRPSRESRAPAATAAPFGSGDNAAATPAAAPVAVVPQPKSAGIPNASRRARVSAGPPASAITHGFGPSAGAPRSPQSSASAKPPNSSQVKAESTVVLSR